MLTDRQKDYLKKMPIEIAKKPVEIFTWNQRSLEIAADLTDKVKKADCNLEVFLVGSTPLKIAGEKDIDLTSSVSSSDFQKQTIKLEKIFGKPNKINESSVVWHIVVDNYNVGFYLVDPEKSDQLKRQLYMDNLFRKNLYLLKNYEQLKISLHGFSHLEYTKRKFEFFNKITK